MKANPTRENAAMLTKRADNGAPADSRPHPQIASKPGRSGTTTFSHINAVSITKAEIWRTAEAIKQAGCRDVLIVDTAEYVRFIVTIKLPKPR
jgi:hypothetical protein